MQRKPLEDSIALLTSASCSRENIESRFSRCAFLNNTELQINIRVPDTSISKKNSDNPEGFKFCNYQE